MDVFEIVSHKPAVRAYGYGLGLYFNSTKFGQLILMKIIEIVAIRSHIFRL